jgi:hypothetical protein
MKIIVEFTCPCAWIGGLISGQRRWLRLVVSFPNLTSDLDGFIDSFSRPFCKFEVLILERRMKN